MASATTSQRYLGCVQNYAFGLCRATWWRLPRPHTVAAKDSTSREKETRMKSSIHTKSMVAGLAVGALWLAAPAAGSVAEPAAAPPVNAHAQVAQLAGHAQQTDVVIRRDGAHATPFVADLSPEASVPGASDGFDWGDAAIGAGAGLLAAALLMAGSTALGGRRRTSKAAGAVSQGA
jgi:hypothetical protein